MRILLLLVVAFFSTNTLSQTHLSVAGAKQIPLLRFTDKLWSDRAAALPLPGTYERCGNYLFTFTPSEELGVQHRRMIGFATIGAKGGIGDIVI